MSVGRIWRLKEPMGAKSVAKILERCKQGFQLLEN